MLTAVLAALLSKTRDQSNPAELNGYNGGTLLYYGAFRSPGGQKIYKSIPSLEVTFKKVTFKVLMNSCSLGATRRARRAEFKAQVRSSGTSSFLVVSVTTGSSGAWDCMRRIKLRDTLINITGFFSPFSAPFIQFSRPTTNVCYRHGQTLILSLYFKVLLQAWVHIPDLSECSILQVNKLTVVSP